MGCIPCSLSSEDDALSTQKIAEEKKIMSPNYRNLKEGRYGFKVEDVAKILSKYKILKTMGKGIPFFKNER